MFVGHGATPEAASESIRLQKLASLPVSTKLLPTATTPPELDELIRDRVSEVITLIAELNTIAMKPPAGIIEEYTDTVRMMLFDMYEIAHPLWESTFPTSEDIPDGKNTLAGAMLRMQRKGNHAKDVKVRILLPGDKDYPTSKNQ